MVQVSAGWDTHAKQGQATATPNSRSYIGRFAQADTIIPEQSQGVQAWDRYAYTNNNPARYIDPAGHRLSDGCQTDGCNIQTQPVEGVSQEQHQRLRAIQEEAELMSTLMHSGEITDVEALARILEFASPLYGDDADGLLTDVGIVVGGLNGTTVIGADDPMSEYYVGYDAFDPEIGTTAFNSTYNPNDDNQVRHFLAGASGSVNYGGLGEAILLAQEPSPEDDALYRQAFAFVNFLQSGASLRDAGDWVLSNLR